MQTILALERLSHLLHVFMLPFQLCLGEDDYGRLMLIDQLLQLLQYCSEAHHIPCQDTEALLYDAMCRLCRWWGLWLSCLLLGNCRSCGACFAIRFRGLQWQRHLLQPYVKHSSLARSLNITLFWPAFWPRGFSWRLFSLPLVQYLTRGRLGRGACNKANMMGRACREGG